MSRGKLRAVVYFQKINGQRVKVFLFNIFRTASNSACPKNIQAPKATGLGS